MTSTSFTATPIETVAALLHFSDTPAIFVCRPDNPDALPPRVRASCDIWLRSINLPRSSGAAGIRRGYTARFNAVDIPDRFPRRKALPERPRR